LEAEDGARLVFCKSSASKVVRFTIQRPDLGKALAETEKDIERAVTSGMRGAADGLKQDFREDVVAAGLGERLFRTWRGKTFPEVGESAEAAAYVWSRAPKIVHAFDRGVVIRSARGLFLAIPIESSHQARLNATGSVSRAGVNIPVNVAAGKMANPCMPVLVR
jgi:broad specificity phosphatase PhoE